MSDLNNVKNVQPLADFNWDEFENGASSNVSKQDLEKAYDETLNKIQEHEVVEGTVISIDKKEVVVNIGYKSDGIIPLQPRPEGWRQGGSLCRGPGGQEGSAGTFSQEGSPEQELGAHQQGYGEQ